MIAALFVATDDAVLRQSPAEQEWSLLEIVGHLIVSDRPAFEDRIMAILNGELPRARFDAQAANADRDFRAESVDELLGELRASRQRAAGFVGELDPTIYMRIILI